MTMMTMPEPGRIPEFSVGDRMRKARESAEISQEAMAAEIGVSRRSIVRYEGDTGAAPRSTMLLWSFRTGVPLSWLMTGRAETPNGPAPEGGAEPSESSTVRLEGLEPPTFCSGVSGRRVADVLAFPKPLVLPLKQVS